ncbi:DUF58 domain-containing protein [Pseudolysinimonas sp.]|uniref:DUF58 domain-containing protein n=1 Tax=Pseudolysinimonas sp. TaxID=2680009 RepID=UPI003F817191
MARRDPDDADAPAPRGLRRTARMRFTGRGWVTLALGVVIAVLAYPLGRPEFLVAGVAGILLPLVGRFVARVRRPRFEVLRVFSPPVVAAGGTVRVGIRIRNAGATTSTDLVWNDAIPWPASAPPHRLGPIPATGTAARIVTAEYELAPPRRGVYGIGPLVVENQDPFGMAASVAAVGVQDRLVVIPAVGDLPSGGPVLADGEGAAQLVQRRATGNDDDLTTREYRPGDALRRVHWRASARHGELMVRQEEHRSHPDARLVVDTRLGGYPDARPDAGETWDSSSSSEAFEWVVRMTASLGMHLEANGFQVTVEETALPQIDALGERWEGGRRAEGFLTSLAAVRLLERPVAELAGAVPDTSGPLFALVGDPEDATIEWLLRRRRGADLAVAFTVDAREEVLDRLADAGWTVVPVAAGAEPGDAWRAISAVTEATHGAH